MVHLIHNGGRLTLFAGIVTARDPALVQRYQTEISDVSGASERAGRPVQAG